MRLFTMLQKKTLNSSKKAVEFYKKMQWIPAENPPEVDEEGYSEYILLNFTNTTVHEIGQYVADEDGGGAYYIGDDDKLCLSYGFFVDAWMPLPERYREEERLEELKQYEE